MERANSYSTISLSDLFTDPMLRQVFRDAERDQGFAFAIPSPDEPDLYDGAEAEMEFA